MKKDIENRNDIRTLVVEFYDKLLKDKTMRPFFEKVLKKGLDKHFDILVDFWDYIIFHNETYQRNPMVKHVEVNNNTPINKESFKIWLNYFNSTIDEIFEGKNAHIAKTRALSIATVMQLKILK